MIGTVALMGAVSRLLLAVAPIWTLGLTIFAVGAWAWKVRRDVMASCRTPGDTARAVDRAGNTQELLRTALSVEAGTASGDPVLAAQVLRDARARLAELAPLADRPFRVPREGVGALMMGIALCFVPLPTAAEAPIARGGGLGPQADTPAAARTTPRPLRVAFTDTPTAGEATDAASSSGSGDRASQGGAATGLSAGTAGSQGQTAASGDAASAQAEGGATPLTGSTGGRAREAGTAGTDELAQNSDGGSRGPTGEGDDAPEQSDTPVADQDGRTMQSPVEQTAAETDAVRSDAETMGLASETPDDGDAKTRDVAGTLDVRTDGPQFFDAEEKADDEQDGKGGAGGWTVGLSQPGRGGVNDASGSTWRTEAGLDNPPDWTDAPSEWVDAAWQDSPAGVIRRVRGGEAGGRGTAEYQAAWHRYAAIAESDAAFDEVPAGRRDLARAYFLAIAPSETP